MRHHVKTIALILCFDLMFLGGLWIIYALDLAIREGNQIAIGTIAGGLMLGAGLILALDVADRR